jgi:cytochrome b6-f complex iron-sulfur subunit
MTDPAAKSPPTSPPSPERRSFLSRLAGFTLIASVASAYGAFAAILGRFLFPARPAATEWQFLTELARLQQGDSLVYVTPAGASVAVARRTSGTDADAFIALSSTCPHLGCQVHWEGQNNRFFCPCHNGAFNPEGKAIAGPPAEAGQSLPRFDLKVDAGSLYIKVPVEALAKGPGRVLPPPRYPRGGGHDPCLAPPLATASASPGSEERA